MNYKRELQMFIINLIYFLKIIITKSMEAFEKSLNQAIQKNRRNIFEIHKNIDQLIGELQISQLSLQENENVCNDLYENVKQIKPIKINVQQNIEYHQYISKANKILKNIAKHDINDLFFQNEKEIEKVINQVISLYQMILEKFMRDGNFQLLSSFDFQNETILNKIVVYKRIYNLIKEFKNHQLDPILDWALENKQQLQKINNSFLFNLFKLQFIQILNHEGKYQAIMFVRQHTSEIGQGNMKQIQYLISKILTLQLQDIKISDEQLWNQLYEQLNSIFQALYDVQLKTPLQLLINEGLHALQTFLEYKKIFQGKCFYIEKRAWFKSDEFPIEISSKHHFHSIFVCPVSKEIVCDKNYPILLPCHHVISKFSYDKIVINRNKYLCPLCNKQLERSFTQRLII